MTKVLKRRYEEVGEPRTGFAFARKDGSRVPSATIDPQHERAVAKLPFKFRINDFRLTFLTRLVESSADAFRIMKLAGHGSVSIPKRSAESLATRFE